MTDRWMMDYCSVFTKQPFSTRKRGSTLNGTGTESNLLFSKRIRGWGFLCKKTINEYRSGSLHIWHTVIRYAGKSQLMIMSNKWIFLSLHYCAHPMQLIFVIRHMYIIVCEYLSAWRRCKKYPKKDAWDSFENTRTGMNFVILVVFSKFLGVFLPWI